MQGTSRFKVSVMTFAVMLAFAGVAQAQSQSVKSAPTDAVVGHAPEIVAITITGTPNGPGGTFTTNDVLTMEYEFTDPDQDPIAVAATEATIQWYSGTTAVGTFGSRTVAANRTHRLTLPARGLPRGDYRIRLTARAGADTVTSTLLSRRL